jgi:hypothetical protein
MLRRLWQDMEPPLVISQQLTASDPTGRKYTPSAVSGKAVRMHLPSRNLRLCGTDGDPIRRLVSDGYTNAEIGLQMGIAQNAVAYRVTTMISYGLLKKRKPGPRKRPVNATFTQNPPGSSRVK